MKWALNNWEQIAVALYEHIVIAAASLSIAFVISLVVGIIAARSDRVFRWSIAMSGL